MALLGVGMNACAHNLTDGGRAVVKRFACFCDRDR